MTKKLTFMKPILLTFLILCLSVNALPVRFVHAADELGGNTPVLFPFINEEDLKARIVNSPEFISKHALFAHYLGFGWCGGTASQYVGQDFDFRKEGDNYVLQARYNPNDPYAGGYWADNRLKMTISNVRFYIEPESIVTGEEKITQLDPEVAQSYEAVNRSDQDDKASTSFSYTKSNTVGHSTNYSFQENLNIKRTMKVSVLFLSGAMEQSFGFTAGQSWSDSTTESDSSTVSTKYDTTIPAKSKKTIKLMSYKTKSEVPYTANIYMDYDITFSGFLRWGGNARTDHPGDRPQVNVTFGAGNLTAPEEIERMYTNRTIPGYSSWDFAWMENEFGAGNVKSVIQNITRRPMGANIPGKFTFVDGTHVEVVAEEAVPLTPEELGGTSITTKSLMAPEAYSLPKTSGLTIENVYNNPSADLQVDKSTITTDSGTIDVPTK